MPDWWEDGDEVQRIARELVSDSTLTTPSEVVYYYEKPWKWSKERDHIMEHERILTTIQPQKGRSVRELERLVEQACRRRTPPEETE